MRFVVAMDSFKGSITSLEAGEAVKRGILAACPDATVTVLPLADGGEGTLDCIAPFIRGEEITLTVKGPLGEPVSASYIYDSADKVAYIEMARASGLTLVDPKHLDAVHASSYGTGELILDAIRRGARSVTVFIGGSATSDGGAGMLQAMSARFLDKNGEEIGPGAAGLADLVSADLSSLAGRDVSFTVASDVSNPLCGSDGCAFVYGPQKGASFVDCKYIEENLYNYSRVLGYDPFEKGTGAAGGMSFALKNVLGAEVKSGADIVTTVTGAAREISLCNIVITGEGCMDGQTIRGKAPMQILKLGLKYDKPVIGICGKTGDDYAFCLAAGFSKIYPLIHPVMEHDAAIQSVEETTEEVMRKIIE